MKIISRLYKVLIIIFFVLLPFYFSGCNNKTQEDIDYSVKIGLHVESDGTITNDNKTYYGIGLNYYGAFAHSYDNVEYDYEEAFKIIASYDIPFVRLPLCGYNKDYYEQFDKNPDELISKMKNVLDCAKENNVGVIVNLLWWDPAVSSHVNEKRSAMGDINSKTTIYAKEYVNKIVSEFLNHEAVWAWEIGNEYNLDADLFDADFKDYLFYDASDVDEFDYYTTVEMNTFFVEIAKEIRTIDNYRMISTGHGDLRDSAYNMYISAKNNINHKWTIDWTKNKKNLFYDMVDITTPNPIDTVSVHLQIESDDLTIDRFNKHLTLDEYLKEYVKAAKKQNKSLFFGEFGDVINDKDNEIDLFKQTLDAIKKSKIQIASSWQFQDFTLDGNNKAKLELLKEYNNELIGNSK